jgi:hypothetical protein
MLVDDGEVVGAYFAYYSERTIDGRNERFCNLGPWSVLPQYRLHALRLLMALLAQDGYHFTDLTPNADVVAINTRLGFRFIDTATVLLPHIPSPTWFRRIAITSDPIVLGRTLTGEELQIYRDHTLAPAARHVTMMTGEDSCYVMFRVRRWCGLVVVYVLHVSNPRLFSKLARLLGRHFLLHHGAVAMRIETRLAKALPHPCITIRPPAKMLLSSRLETSQVDDLYSELVC